MKHHNWLTIFFNRRIPVVGKHSRKIQSGCWSSGGNLLALGGSPSSNNLGTMWPIWSHIIIRSLKILAWICGPQGPHSTMWPLWSHVISSYNILAWICGPRCHIVQCGPYGATSLYEVLYPLYHKIVPVLGQHCSKIVGTGEVATVCPFCYYTSMFEIYVES